MYKSCTYLFFHLHILHAYTRKAIIMTSYNYSISTYYDFGCTSSPIIMMSSKSGCTSIASCGASNLNKQYAASAISCSADPIVIPDPTRDYVIKSVFPNSETCADVPLTQYAVAADYACHSNPHAGNNANIAYFRVSCNGALSTWEECLDSLCTKCVSTAAEKTCMMTGAGTSNGFQCIKAKTALPTTTKEPLTSSTSSIPSSTVLPTETSTASSANHHSQSRFPLFVTMTIISLQFLCLTIV